MRELLQQVKGSPAVDGAGVQLVRVLGPRTMKAFDPFLMLDAFDSKDPKDYINGFPMHPHRGIETFTYLVKGQIDHEDTLGNAGTINDGESQWMTAGGGILHQEMPQEAPHMLGLQLWINLPKEEKMTQPKYFEINASHVKEIKEEGAEITLIAGTYLGATAANATSTEKASATDSPNKKVEGVKGNHIDTDIMDIRMEPNRTLTLNTAPDKNLFVYLFSGDAAFGAEKTRGEAKSAILFTKGSKLQIESGANGLHLFLAAAEPLGEPIAWGGPIVMNTQEELDQAFADLRQGNFIK